MQGLVNQKAENQGEVDEDRSRKRRDCLSSGEELGDEIPIHNGKKLNQVYVSFEYVLFEVEEPAGIGLNLINENSGMEL